MYNTATPIYVSVYLVLKRSTFRRKLFLRRILNATCSSWLLHIADYYFHRESIVIDLLEINIIVQFSYKLTQSLGNIFLGPY